MIYGPMDPREVIQHVRQANSDAWAMHVNLDGAELTPTCFYLTDGSNIDRAESALHYTACMAHADLSFH